MRKKPQKPEKVIKIVNTLSMKIDFATAQSSQQVSCKKNGIKYSLKYCRKDNILMFSLQGFGNIFGWSAAIDVSGITLDIKPVSLDGDVTLHANGRILERATFYLKPSVAQGSSFFD